MVDEIRLGGAYIDVGFKFAKAESQLAGIKSGIGAKLENALKSGAKGVAVEKEADTAAKSRLETHKSINNALDQQINKTNRLASVGVSTGAKINRMGMMGAQLSYAAQDFVTGLAMGNLNMAIMGASNNLGMMAMQISSAAAAWTTLGLVSIPMAITAIKAFIGEEDNAKAKLEEEKRLLDALAESFKGLAQVRAVMLGRFAGGRMDVGQIRDVKSASKELEQEQQAIDLAKERQKILQRDIKGLEATKIMQAVGAGATLVGNVTPEEAAKRVGGPSARAGGENLRNYLALKDAVMRLPTKITPGRDEAIAANLVKFGMARFENAEGTFQVEKEGNALFLKRFNTLDQQTAKQEEINKLQHESKDLEAEIAKSTARIPKLQEQQKKLISEELNFAERRQKAGFNKYQQHLIDLDEAQAKKERQIREDYGKVILQPAMTKEARKKEIEDQFESEMTTAAKMRRKYSEDQGRIGRHLSKKQADEVAALELAATARKQKDLAELEAKGPPGAKTAAEPMLEASRDEFRRKRVELAEQFAGGKAGFAGISELSRQVQTGIGGRGMSIPEQTNALLAGQEKATRDLISFMQTTGIKVQGGGLQ